MSEILSRVCIEPEKQDRPASNSVVEASAWKLIDGLISQIKEGVLLCERNSKGELERAVLVNDRLCELTRYTLAEYLAMDAETLALHTRLTVSAADWEQIDGGGELQLLTVWMTKQQEAVPLNIKVSSIELVGKRLLLLVVEDLREQEKLKRMEDFAKERDKRYRNMLKVSPEPILFHSEEIIIYVNDSAQQLLGAKKERELLGRSIFDIIHPEDQSIVREQFRALEFDEATSSFKEYRMVRLDGKSIELEISSIAMFQYMKRPVIQSVLRDVTERKAQERLARQSDKLLAVSQLAAGLAHEIRNPLTAMKGFLQLMKSKPGEYSAYVDIVLTELERIHYTVGEFMILARPSEIKHFRPAHVDKLIHDVITVMEPQALSERVEMIYHVDPAVPKLYCDERQIKQVLVNIVKNAIEAMAEGGGKLWINVALTDVNTIRFKFIDTGTGIDPELLPRLGDPFFTTKDNGTGLGLMVSKQILELHEGKMDILSEKKLGTTVWVDLPVRQRVI